MNKAQAIAILRKRLGAKFAYRVDETAPNAEQREVIRAAWKDAKRVADEAVAAHKARCGELLRNDALYQELKAKAAQALESAEAARAGINRHRISAGRDQGWYFSVVVEGDNWGEVVDKATGSA